MEEGIFIFSLEINWLQIIYFLNFVCAMLIIFVQRKQTSVKLAWILAMVFLPGVGLALYFLFGGGVQYDIMRKFRRMRANFTGCLRVLYENTPSLAPYEHTVPRGMELYDPLITYIENFGGFLSCGNHIELISDGAKKFDMLIKDIRQAQEFIHLCYFIIKPDDEGHELIQVLSERAAAGVEVTLLYDPFGFPFASKKLFEPLRQAGGQVVEFFPGFLFSVVNLRANYRNHRKIVVIDGKCVYTGGMNIGDEYRGRDKRKKPWVDAHIKMTGPAVNHYEIIFLHDLLATRNQEDLFNPQFIGKYLRPQLPCGSSPVQVLTCGPEAEAEEIKSSFIRMMYSARKSVYIQTPYFIPDSSFMEALCNVARSGIDVRMCIPNVPDKRFVYRATLGYCREAMEAGVRVFRVPGFLHSKLMIIDDEIATIGTTNMDIRSFSLHFEVNSFVYDPEFAHQCTELFLRDQSVAKEIMPDWYASLSLIEKAAQELAKLLSPLL